ncbi:Crp/Fnr family transcriptional regulator [Konateibacter massiliensis]|uniref:Crp/Fnr family transcriptional regulator n=1 Tax=Konateibacter massiliensis TaxID=2002841 RepID=UPI0015D4EB20|nr:Crp/Fnr family transcriptional regulator [Konateibacter massiliensis]
MTIKEACTIPKILQYANASTKERLVTCASLKTFQKGEFIFQDKENVSQLYFVIKGYVSIFKVNKKQDKKAIFVYGEGEMLNEVIIQEPVASVSCEALGEVIILVIPRGVFLELLEQDFGLTKAILGSLAVKVRRLYHQLGNTSNMMNLERQVAAKLWRLAKDFGVSEKDEVQINFDLSITFLADMIGSKRESVSRAVKCLSEKGIIRAERNRFYICDMEQLIAVVKSEKA